MDKRKDFTDKYLHVLQTGKKSSIMCDISTTVEIIIIIILIIIIIRFM